MHSGEATKVWSIVIISLPPQDLTWRLSNSNNDGLTNARVRDTMRKAFKKWSDVTNLNFKEITTGTPDIWVRFARGYHQDPYPFDGQGGTLAHAFYPMNNKGMIFGYLICLIHHLVFY